MSAVPDEDVLAYARTYERVLLTLNRKHFIRLHARHPQHAGLIICPFNKDYAGQIQRIQAVINTHPDLANQLIRINRPA